MLAFACAFTMFAGAAFTDQESISENNSDAVDLLTTLKIIQGYEDGSFKPEETVTRAQMAKMIYTIRNGGVDDATAYKNVTTTFKDLGGKGLDGEDLGEEHWAKGHITYLQNTGIIAGYSDTVFAPNKVVTTGEALKMALVLGGYRADKAELTGSKWLNNTVSLATTNGLTRNVKSGISEGCSRQDAAQILSNVLEMTAVQWSEFVNGFVNDSKTGLSMGGEKITVGNKWMDLTTYVGTLVSSGKMAIEYEKEKRMIAGKDKFILDVDTIDGEDWDNYRGTAYNYYGTRWAKQLTFKDGKDHTDLVGEEVKVLVGKNYETVYGIYATGRSKVVQATFDAIDWDDDNHLKINGVSYDTEYATVYTDNKAGVEIANSALLVDAKNKASQRVGKVSDTAKLIDSDDNGEYETIITKTVTVSEIVSVTSNSIAISAVGSRDKYISTDLRLIKNNNTIEFKDNTIYEGVAKNDYAVVTKNLYDDNYIVEKATIVSGTVNGKVDNERKVRIDGNWYTLANDNSGRNKTNLINTDDLYTIDESRYTFENNDAITLVVVGGIAYHAKSTAGNDKNRSVLMVYDKKKNTGGWNDTLQAKVILADGNKYTVDIDEERTSNGAPAKKFAEIKVGNMYYYEINNDGEYAFFPLETKRNNAGYAEVIDYDGGISPSTDRVNGQAIADDAVVFALLVEKESSNKIADWITSASEKEQERDIDLNAKSYDAKVYTGKTIKDAAKSGTVWGNWPQGTTKGSGKYEGVGQYLTEKDNGFNYVRMLNIRLADEKLDTTTNYGYLITDSVRTRVNGQWRMEYTFWNGTANEKAFEVTDSDRRNDLKKNDVLNFAYITTAGRDGGDNWSEIKDVEAPAKFADDKNSKAVYAAMIGANATSVQLVSHTRKAETADVDSDTIIFYVDSNASDEYQIGKTGFSGYDFRVGPVNNDKEYPINTIYILDNDKDVKLLVIDVENELKNNGGEDYVPKNYATFAKVDVKNFEELKNALAQQTGSPVKMTADITIPDDGETYSIPSGISVESTDNEKLTINGELSGNGSAKVADLAAGSKGKLNTKVTVTGKPSVGALDSLKGDSNASLTLEKGYTPNNGKSKFYIKGETTALNPVVPGTYKWSGNAGGTGIEGWYTDKDINSDTVIKVDDPAQLENAFKVSDNVEVSKNATISSDLTIKKGQTVTFAGTVTAESNKITIEEGGTANFGDVVTAKGLTVGKNAKATFAKTVNVTDDTKLNGNVTFNGDFKGTGKNVTIGEMKDGNVIGTGNVTFKSQVNAGKLTVNKDSSATFDVGVNITTLDVDGSVTIKGNGNGNVDIDNVSGTGTLTVDGSVPAEGLGAPSGSVTLELNRATSSDMNENWSIAEVSVADNKMKAPAGTYKVSSKSRSNSTWDLENASNANAQVDMVYATKVDTLMTKLFNIKVTGDRAIGAVTIRDNCTLTIADGNAVGESTSIKVGGKLIIENGKPYVSGITANGANATVEFKGINDISGKNEGATLFCSAPDKPLPMFPSNFENRTFKYDSDNNIWVRTNN